MYKILLIALFIGVFSGGAWADVVGLPANPIDPGGLDPGVVIGPSEPIFPGSFRLITPGKKVTLPFATGGHAPSVVPPERH